MLPKYDPKIRIVLDVVLLQVFVYVERVVGKHLPEHGSHLSLGPEIRNRVTCSLFSDVTR
jgi:hypothetical protein